MRFDAAIIIIKNAIRLLNTPHLSDQGQNFFVRGRSKVDTASVIMSALGVLGIPNHLPGSKRLKSMIPLVAAVL